MNQIRQRLSWKSQIPVRTPQAARAGNEHPVATERPNCTEGSEANSESKALHPVWLTLCYNVDRYGINSNNVVVKLPNAEDKSQGKSDFGATKELHGPCLIFSCHHKDRVGSLLLCEFNSGNGGQLFYLRCDTVFEDHGISSDSEEDSEKSEKSKWIRALHCDSNKQQIFIAQFSRVVVADLSGQHVTSIKKEEAGGEITAMTGNDRLLFLFVCDGKQTSIRVWDKETQVLFDRPYPVASSEAQTNAGQTSGRQDGRQTGAEFDGGASLSLANDNDLSIFLTRESNENFGKVVKICLITSKILMSIPRASADLLAFPADLTIDSKSRVFVTDHEKSLVQVFSSEGTLLQTFGQQEGEEGQLRNPCGITSLNYEGKTHVIIADCAKSRLSVWAEDQ